MRISVIVPCKGRLGYLKQTAPRLIGQRDLEYVLVDWDCPDSSGDWLEQHHPSAKVVRVAPRPWFHLNGARNAGALAASGELLAFTDVDMRYDASFADAIRAAWEPGSVVLLGARHGDCGFVALSREDYWRTGGYDETYTGYGYDDHEMRRRLDVLGLRPKRLLSLARYHLHHSNEERTQYYEEKDQRKSQRRNAWRLEHETVRVFHEHVLMQACGEGPDEMPTEGAAGAARPDLRALSRLVRWKRPARVLDLYPTGRDEPDAMAAAAPHADVSALTAEDPEDAYASVERQGRRSGPFDLVCMHGGAAPHHVAIDTCLALRWTSPAGTLAWLDCDAGHEEVRAFIETISDQAITVVEGSTVAFAQLSSALHERLVDAVHAELARLLQSDGAHGGRVRGTPAAGRVRSGLALLRQAVCRSCEQVADGAEPSCEELASTGQLLGSLLSRLDARCPRGHWGPGAVLGRT